MAHYKLETVSVNPITKELKNQYKRHILQKIFKEMDECKEELLKLNAKEINNYKIHLQTILDKLTNISHFLSVVAFAGTTISMFGQYSLKYFDLSFSNFFIYIMTVVALVFVGTYSIMTKRRSRVFLALKIIETIESARSKEMNDSIGDS